MKFGWRTRLDGSPCRYRVPTRFLKKKRRGTGNQGWLTCSSRYLLYYLEIEPENGTIVRWFEIVCKILLTCQKL